MNYNFVLVKKVKVSMNYRPTIKADSSLRWGKKVEMQEMRGRQSNRWPSRRILYIIRGLNTNTNTEITKHKAIQQMTF